MADNSGSVTGFEIYKKPYTGMTLSVVNVLVRIIITAIITICCVSIGMTTLNIPFNLKEVIYVSIGVSSICSVMYFNIFAAFAVLIGSILYILNYISDNAERLKLGVLSIFNTGYEVVKNSLGLPYADGFNEVMGQDFSNEIRIITLLVTIILSVLISFFIGRYMSVIFSALVMLSAICYCFFLENVQDYISVGLIIICFAIVLYLRLTGFKRILLSKYFKEKKKKYRLNKIDGTIMIEAVAIILALLLIVSFGIGIVFSRNLFDTDVKKMDINNYIKYTIKDVMVLKYAEYKKFKVPETVDYGQLGFYSCVQPEFKSEFYIKTDAIDEEKLFLREFIGADYSYRGNNWTSKDAVSDINMTDLTADTLKNSNADFKTIDFKTYRKNDFTKHIYVPYYSSVANSSVYDYINDCNIKGNSQNEYSVDVYSDNGITVNDEEYKKYVYDNYTYIAPENKAVINEILKEININKNSDNIDNKIKQYFKENYIYEFDNGVVPFGEDFVNYFLTENKQGSFAQFASATVLIYRAMGIPARYAGGYAVDNKQILAGKYKNGKFEVEVNRANMYAWAEVYEDGFGWRYIDTSPSPEFSELAEKYDNEDNTENSAAMNHNNILEEYFKPIENEYYNPLHFGRNLIKLLLAVLFIIILLIISFFGIKYISKYIMWLVKYKGSTDDVKAYMLMEKLRNKLKLKPDCDYTQFGIAAAERGMSKDDANELCDIANKLVFSNSIKADELIRLKHLISKL